MVFAVNVIGLLNEIFELLAKISPDRLTVPPRPFSVKGPLKIVEFEEFKFNTPVCVMMQGPLFIEMRPPVIVKLVPFKLIPAKLLVFKSPIIVVVPDPFI